MRWVPLLFLAIWLPAGADDQFCRAWNAADPESKPSIVRRLVDSLNPEHVDMACLRDRTDELVRWVNRACHLNPDLTTDQFSHGFIGRAWDTCP